VRADRLRGESSIGQRGFFRKDILKRSVEGDLFRKRTPRRGRKKS